MIGCPFGGIDYLWKIIALFERTATRKILFIINLSSFYTNHLVVRGIRCFIRPIVQNLNVFSLLSERTKTAPHIGIWKAIINQLLVSLFEIKWYTCTWIYTLVYTLNPEMDTVKNRKREIESRSVNVYVLVSKLFLKMWMEEFGHFQL